MVRSPGTRATPLPSTPGSGERRVRGGRATMDGMSETTDPTESSSPAPLEALTQVVRDVERAAARVGWDHAPSLYALVPTADLLEQPGVPDDVSDQLRRTWDGTPTHLSAIVQEDLPDDELEDLLTRLAWPDSVAGAALTVERVIVPPEVEDEAPEDPDAALEFISTHPARTEVRLAVGALRTGETWTAVRARPFDSDDQVGTGPDLVPVLTKALLASFATVEE